MANRFVSIPLNPLRAFAIASRHRTFTSAAKYMGISQVAISRQIGILEDYLGVQLFERQPRSVKLTEQGRAFGNEIAPIFDNLEAAMNRMVVAEREHTINLRIYPTLAHHWLLPRLSRFYQQYPDYEVRLDTRVEPLDFRGTHLNVAVQLGDGKWRDAKSCELFDERLDAVCSPEYAKRLGGLKTPDELKKATVLHSKYRRRAWHDWCKGNGVTIAAAKEFEYETSLLTYSAAINGMGIAIAQIDILKDELDSNTLIRPFKAPQQTGAQVHVAWPTSVSVSVQSRRFIDWLLEENAQEPVFFKPTD